MKFFQSLGISVIFLGRGEGEFFFRCVYNTWVTSDEDVVILKRIVSEKYNILFDVPYNQGSKLCKMYVLLLNYISFS